MPAEPRQVADGWRRPGVRLVAAWVTTRLILLTIWAVALIGFKVPSARGDVAYYYRSIAALGAHGPQATMVEYPTPVAALTWLLYSLTRGNPTVFLTTFVVVMVTVDAAFTWWLWRDNSPTRVRAVTFWIAFVALLGPTVYLRFDLLPAVLTSGALLVATRTRPRGALAGALIAVATGLKLWPAATWPAAWGPTRRSRWRSVSGAAVTGGLLIAGSVAWAGWPRLISPLTYQRDRGLQIESVFAGIPMLARIVKPSAYTVELSPFLAFEISGPGTATWLRLASVAALLGYLVIALLAAVLWRRQAVSPTTSVVFMLLAVVILVVANKTFSPQYLLWLGAPVAAGLARVPLPVSTAATTTATRVADHRTMTRIGWSVLVLAALTDIVYPIGYRPLIYGEAGVTAVTIVLTLRNLGMLALLGVLLSWAWRSIIQRRTA